MNIFTAASSFCFGDIAAIMAFFCSSERACFLACAITESLKAGDKVALVGFGTFDVKDRPERTGKNPRTGEPVAIAATRVPTFKAGKGLKDAVAE